MHIKAAFQIAFYRWFYEYRYPLWSFYLDFMSINGSDVNYINHDQQTSP